MEEKSQLLEYAHPKRESGYRGLIPIILAFLLVATIAWLYWKNSGIGVFAIEFKPAPMNWKETCSILGVVAGVVLFLYMARRWQTPLARFLLAIILLFALCMILLVWWLSRPRGGLQSAFPVAPSALMNPRSAPTIWTYDY